MSDSDLRTDDQRAAELAQRLLLSAKGDGLDAAQLATLGRRNGIDEKAVIAMKVPLAAMLLIGGLVTLGGAFAYSRANDDKPVAPTPIASSPTPAVVEPPRETAVAKDTVAKEASASAPAMVAVTLLPDAPPRSSAPRARPEVAPIASTADLSGEILAIEHVQHAVTKHRIADAKTALADYHRAFPKKLLGQEARVLEIEVLLADGQREEGEARARTFLAGAGADGPYAARVRSLIARPRTP